MTPAHQHSGPKQMKSNLFGKTTSAALLIGSSLALAWLAVGCGSNGAIPGGAGGDESGGAGMGGAKNGGAKNGGAKNGGAKNGGNGGQSGETSSEGGLGEAGQSSAGTAGSIGGASGSASGGKSGSAGFGGHAGATGGSAGTSGGSAGTSGGSAGTSGGSAGTSGGSAGTSGGSAGTSGGSAGTSGGSAGMSGHSGMGGNAGSGGVAGASGGASTCGNKIVEGSEQCDDGLDQGSVAPSGNVFGQVCSNTCSKVSTPACVACENAGLCAESLNNCLGSAVTFNASQQTACFSVMRCVEQSNCFDGTGTLGACYCGTLDTGPCGAAPFTGAGSPNGPCVAEIKAGFPTYTTNQQVLAGLLATDYPSGAAMQRLTCQKTADSSACLTACGLNTGGPTFP